MPRQPEAEVRAAGGHSAAPLEISGPIIAATIRLAQQKIDDGLYDEARGALAVILLANPRHARANHLLGLAAQRAGDQAAAMESLSRAIEAQQVAPDPYVDLALTAEIAHQPDFAWLLLRRALALAPTRADLVLRTCDHLIRAKSWPRAIALAGRALALKRPYPSAQVKLGYALAQCDDWPLALKVFHAAAQENPNDIEAQAALAGALTEAGAPQHLAIAPALTIVDKLVDEAKFIGPIVQYYRDLGHEAEAMRLVKRWLEAHEKKAAKHPVGRAGIRIIMPNHMYLRIGEIAIQLDCLAKMQILGWLDPAVFILPVDKTKVVNQALLDYWRPYVAMVDDPKKLPPLQALAEEIAYNPVYFMLPDGRATTRNRAILAIQRQWEAERRPPLLQLSEHDRRRGREALASRGVPEDAWFVSVHARHATYAGDSLRDREAMRNADIATYIPAMQEIVRRGGWVVRLGDPSHAPLPAMPGVIDYAHSELRSDWMDVFLCAGCRFFLASSSGPFIVSFNFGVPVAAANFYPAAEALYSSRDVFVPKLYRSTKDGALVPLSRCMQAPLSLAYDALHVRELGFEVVDNSPEEVRELAVEMMERLDGCVQYSEADEALQARWRELARPNMPVDPLSRVGGSFLRRWRHLLD